MKIRKGFVSNSSSSSFVAWGIDKDRVEVTDKLLLEYFEKTLKYYESIKDKYSWAEENFESMSAIQTDEEKIKYFEEREHEVIDSILEDSGFDVCYMDGANFFGIEVGRVFKKYPDLKIKDIKQMVSNEINKVFETSFTEEDINYCEFAWRDG